MDNKIRNICVLFLLGIFLSGCAGTPTVKEYSWATRTPTEAEWIRNGEPIEFEGEEWYPADTIENLLDSEVYPVTEYRSVQVFVDYTDVRPYQRLYTRLSKNKFRFFEKKPEHD